MDSSVRIKRIDSSRISIAKFVQSARWKCRAAFAQAMFFISLAVAFSLSACNVSENSSKDTWQIVKKTDTAMGTIVSATLYGSGENWQEDAARLEEDAFTQVRNLEYGLLSAKEPSSEVSLINEAGAATLSDGLSQLLSDCFEVSGASDGAFDVTIGSLTKLWNIDEYALSGEGRPPSEKEIESALLYAGYEKASLSGKEIRLSEGMQLDLGAVGKGYALDRLSDWISSEEGLTKGLKAGVISLGGSIMTLGDKPDGTAWKIAVVDPCAPDQQIGYLELSGEHYVSTSGDYERYFEADGKRYHHILNAKSGYPAESGLKSVTILADSGLMSDILSTACFVLGWDRGEALAERFGAGILAVDENGGIRYNQRMKECFHKTGGN